MTQRDPLFDKIERTLQEIDQINQVHHKITLTMANRNSTQEEFDQVIKSGIDLLKKIDNGRTQG